MAEPLVGDRALRLDRDPHAPGLQLEDQLGQLVLPDAPVGARNRAPAGLDRDWTQGGELVADLRRGKFPPQMAVRRVYGVHRIAPGAAKIAAAEANKHTNSTGERALTLDGGAKNLVDFHAMTCPLLAPCSRTSTER